MRIAVYGVIVAALAQQALAADAPFPILRGTQTYEIASPNYFRWEGVYVGGQVGASTGNLDLTHAAGSLISFFTRESVFVGNVPTWAVLKAVDTRAANYGGFIGYNMQFEDVVLGIEGNYNHTSLSGSSADSLGLLVANSNPNLPASDVTVAAVASMRITDYGTLRGRVGWAAGRFLPYAMIGLAAGVADITRSATLTVVGTHCDGLANPCTTDESKRAFIYGYSAGGGLDVALTSRLFLRGEYEYVKFSPTSDIPSHIHTARVGGGLRF